LAKGVRLDERLTPLVDLGGHAVFPVLLAVPRLL
jgi:hypothetical protein